jgi:hypothetical protein
MFCAVQGVTHVSQITQYPADVSNDTPALWVAHFAHPIEVEWVARTAPTPKDWPRLLLQVSNENQQPFARWGQLPCWPSLHCCCCKHAVLRLCLPCCRSLYGILLQASNGVVLLLLLLL